jgi:tetratricopeptide (TPR) repeat protein
MNLDRKSLGLLAGMAAVLALTCAAYAPGLTGPLVLDDIPQLNSLIAQSGDDPGMLFGNYVISTSGPLGRPVSMMTFIADAVTHGPDIWWWKYDNLLLHLISGLLVFWLTALLVKASPSKLPVDPWTAGLTVGALWLLHPLQVSTVLYTVQRMTELSTLFAFAALVAYSKGRLVQETSNLRGWAIIALGFVVFFPLSVLSKESGLLIPIYCTLLELLVFRFRGGETTRKQIRVLHTLLIAGCVGAVAYVLWNFSGVVLDRYAIRDFTLWQRVLTEFRVVVNYLYMLIAPSQREMGFFHDDVQVSNGLFDPISTILSALALVALFGSAVALRRRNALYAFGVLFFFVSHALESTIFGLELMFEHRNYIGSFGIILALVAVISEAVARQRKVLVVGAVAVICGFSFLTWQRSLTWAAPETMFGYMYRVHPQSPRLNILFAGLYSATGDFDRARQAIDRLKPGPDTELNRLLIDCLQFGEIDESEMSAVSSRPRTVVGAYTTSTVDALVRDMLEGRCKAPIPRFIGVIDFLLASPARSPIDRRTLLFAKADLQSSISEVDAAVDTYLEAQDLSDVYAVPLYRAADTLARHSRPDDARAMLRRAVRMERTTRIRRKDLAETIYSGLGKFYLAHDKPEAALSVYAEAIQAMPDRSRFYVDSAELMLRMGRRSEAQSLLGEMNGRKMLDADQYASAIARIRKELAGQDAAEGAE